MGYLIFRGVSTASLTNVFVSKMPSHKKGGMRYAEYYVKGRDGALNVDEGYEDFELTVILVLLNAGADTRYTVNAWADGTGKLVSSDDLTRAYMASVKSEIEWQRVKAHSVIPPFLTTETYASGDIVLQGGVPYRFTASHSGAWTGSDVTVIPVPNGFFDTATITFDCQPYMVEAVDSQITMTETAAIVNPGSMVSYPLIHCQNGYVYTASGATSIRGEIPFLAMGSNTITITSGITSLVITPHWRWI